MSEEMQPVDKQRKLKFAVTAAAIATVMVFVTRSNGSVIMTADQWMGFIQVIFGTFAVTSITEKHKSFK